MAASGIAEHNEARRRERIILRKAQFLRDQEAQKQKHLAEFKGQAVKDGFYEGNAHDNNELEHARQFNPQNEQAYSAKLPKRYSAIDYMSQW